ncbi:hypothetical protein CPB83DRAFT_744060, partial [Crepidotus variabilis]
EIHKAAWGRRWPYQRRAIITNKGCGLDSDESDKHRGDKSDSYYSREVKPTHWEYTCLGGIEKLTKALTFRTRLQPNLIIRDDYEVIQLALERDLKYLQSTSKNSAAYVVTGNSEIGLTGFVLYLLLYRLERRLPTAIQVCAEYYFIFDDRGVAKLGAYQTSERLTAGTWALCDGGKEASQPCHAFQPGIVTILQVTSARMDKWKTWSNQLFAKLYVLDVPRAIEVAAITKENGFKPTDAITISKKWGTVPRTIFYIL